METLLVKERGSLFPNFRVQPKDKSTLPVGGELQVVSVFSLSGAPVIRAFWGDRPVTGIVGCP